MTRRALVPLLLLVAFSSLGCRKLIAGLKKTGADAGTTPTFAHNEGVDVELANLRITMPGKPKSSTSTEKSEVGTVVITKNELTVGDSYFAASVIVVPDAKSWNSAGSVNGAIDNALASFRGQKGTTAVRSTRESSVTIGGMTGRDVSAVVERSNAVPLYARLLSVSSKNRNVFVLVLVYSEDDPLVKKMFTSFRESGAP